LDEDRVKIAAFGTDNASNVIFMPSNLAGPDLFASPFVVSCKFSFDKTFRFCSHQQSNSHDESESILSKGEGRQEAHRTSTHRSRLPSGYALRQRHDNIVAAARNWPRIVRVRIEWAEGDNDTSTEPTVIEGDIWNDEPTTTRNVCSQRCATVVPQECRQEIAWIIKIGMVTTQNKLIYTLPELNE
jgi:hypothetical protein